jgi:hypothetical protein
LPDLEDKGLIKRLDHSNRAALQRNPQHAQVHQLGWTVSILKKGSMERQPSRCRKLLKVSPDCATRTIILD